MLCFLYLIVLIVSTINNITMQARLIEYHRMFINQVNNINNFFFNDNNYLGNNNNYLGNNINHLLNTIINFI